MRDRIRAGALAGVILIAASSGATPVKPKDCPPAPKSSDCFDTGTVIVDGTRYLVLVCEDGILVYVPIESAGSGFPEQETSNEPQSHR